MLHIHIRITAVSQAQPAICREEVISWTIVPLSTSVRLTNFYVLLRNIISSMALRRTRRKSATGRGMCQIGTYSKTREVYVQYRRRLKRTGATAPVLTGAWGRQSPTSERRNIPAHCLPLPELSAFGAGHSALSWYRPAECKWHRSERKSPAKLLR